ncbi:MAG: hypothetical protein ACREO7_03095 [Pseudoxanthomonas sp.]
MAKKLLVPTLNLDELTDNLDDGLQEISDLVGVALRAALRYNEGGQLNVDLQTGYSVANLGRSNAETKTLFNRWAITCGFRDALEHVSHLLERMHDVILIWDRLPQAEAETRRKAFHRMGLPTKLSRLADNEGLAFGERPLKEVLGINALRNCFVHRRGLITELEIPAGHDSLALSWRTLALFVKRNDEFVRCRANEGFPEEAELFARVVPVNRVFTLGEAVVLSPQEFADLCWTLHNFALHALHALRDMGRGKGLRMHTRSKHWRHERD